MEVAVDKRLPEVDTKVEKVVEVGLQARKPRHQYPAAIVHGLTKGDNGDGEPSENSAYLDKNGGALEDLDIPTILNAAQYDADKNGKTETTVASREETGGRSELIEEEIEEEEVVELEFENAVPKLHTHTMHCPNCDSHITKVVLRRKLIKKKSLPITQEERLFGCSSCFSLFIPTGNGRFNPFSIFRNKSASKPAENEGKVISSDEGNCFSMFRVFRRGPNVSTIEAPPQAHPGYVDRASPSPPSTKDPIKYAANKHPISQGGNDVPNVEGETYTGSHDGSHLDVKSPPEDESRIDVPPDTSSTTNQDQTQRLVGQDSTSFEILKSIVYGGLMEVIASLSVVASAAASDATTLSIIALALANLIGGIIIIGHNLWDLRDDCYKFSSQQTNQETRNKYKELLGQVEHFPLHVFFAILSFLVFGIIPPVAYGYSFHETNDKDFTIVVVAAASLLCVGLLAIFKAYIDRCTGFLGYVKTVVYYVATAVLVSGVSYVAGNLVTRVIEELGLFQTNSGVAMSLLPEVVSMNPSLAYY